jgi:hypothetical protein
VQSSAIDILCNRQYSSKRQTTIKKLNFYFRSKYFRGRRIHTHYDILVEQAEFRDVSVQANSVTGVTASIVAQQKGANKVIK